MDDFDVLAVRATFSFEAGVPLPSDEDPAAEEDLPSRCEGIAEAGDLPGVGPPDEGGAPLEDRSSEGRPGNWAVAGRRT